MSHTEPPCSLRPDASRLLTPRQHGQILIDPPLPRLRAALAGGRPGQCVRRSRGLHEAFGLDFPELSAQTRQDLLAGIAAHAARIDAPPPPPGLSDRLWVLTGHQVEFYHAGVWAKVVAADALARPAGAVAIDVLVDHDILDELGFDVPVRLPGDAPAFRREPVTWAVPGPIAADGLLAPAPDEFARWDEQLAARSALHTEPLAAILSALAPRSDRSRDPYTPWMSRARQRLEAALGLDVWHLPTSLFCDRPAFLAFVAAWLRHAPSWVPSYNRHLALYRKAAGIKNPAHPMPDLALTPDRIELPFWIYRPGEPRARLLLRRTPEPALLLGDQAIPLPGLHRSSAWSAADLLRAALASGGGGAVIRPRALTLTMFLRLFAADLFIHGLGGALYDRITDALLDELFGIQAPYACVSAAWLLPLAEQTAPPEDLSALRHRRHHLEHNPQQAINPFLALRTDIAELIRDRREILARLNASLAADRPAPRAVRRAGRPARRDLFRQLHQVNADIHARSPAILARLDDQIAETRRQLERNKVLTWREYFFALHTTASLTDLIEKIRAS